MVRLLWLLLLVRVRHVQQRRADGGPHLPLAGRWRPLTIPFDSRRFAMKTLRCAALLAVALVMVLPAGSARAQDDNTLVELMRTDVKTEKKEIIADNLKLTD